MITVSSIITKHLKKWGVSHVFGVPGKAVTPLIVELDNQHIQYVLSKHEGGAGFEAAGFALVSQTLGVAIGTSGPGGTNMITSAAQAKASHAPVLFITGHPTVKATGKALGQDSSGFGNDIVRLFEPVTKFSHSVERGDMLHTYLRHAVEQAFTGIKGPVHLNIPADVLMEEIEPFDLPLPNSVQPMISSNLSEVVRILDQAKNPLLFLGKGVHSTRAYKQVQEFADRWNIPVMTTPSGKGTFPTKHDLSLGGFGLGGTHEADNFAKQNVDVMVVIGTRLSDMSLAGVTKEMYPKKIIHFDMDVTFIGKSIPVPTIAVLGDLRANVEKILELTSDRTPKKSSIINRIQSNPNHYYTEPYISSGLAIKTIQSRIPEESLIFGDCGSHTFFAIRDLDIHQPGTFIFDSYFGAMGHGIGYSIGAKAASPDRNIVCLTGDGCLLMHGTEISTSVNYNFPVIFVVLNNKRLDMVDKGMAAHLGKAVGTSYDIPVNGALFGKSLGAHGFRCSTIEEIHDALDFAIQANRSTIVEIMVDPYEIPPTMKRG
ncbi:thiamine pyrophosphate-binding protein [Domibacillus epiphyticus]|uniref:Acetolactate synthase n=1 Tax=Domibacillus epiphyticus TaxID=1714355 RepID=A0A1V2A3S6_9BACI|nr:thiamine pyrophosphate-binding protein [Domibacillus epiphyticus]OMP65648.1 acetolactate synthase [Domibacillus epiphyticus]